MKNKLDVLNQYHNNYWVKYKIGQALIDAGEVHSMVHTRLEGLRSIFQSIGHPYATLAVAFFDRYTCILKRGLIELGNQPGAVPERAGYMSDIEQQLIDRIVQAVDEGIGEQQACESIIHALSFNQ